MNLIRIKCAFCKKEFFRPSGKVNETKKFGWRQYCSLECQIQKKLRRIKRTCANPRCKKIFYRSLKNLKKSKSGRNFCSRSCAVSVNNSEFPKRKRRVKKCNYCNKEFSGKGKEFCSRKCKDKAQIISKEELYKQIKEFYKRNKRIPLKREFPHYNAIRARFGTWNKAIESAGFESNPVMFAKKCIANDGHKCDSFAEKIIDDWFYERRIKHKKEVPYPENKLLSADFVVGKNLIEYFGLSGVIREYDEFINKKRQLCKKYKLSLTEIYPKDLFPVNHLSEIIKTKKL